MTKPNMIIFDSAYTYQMIIKRKMIRHITSRNPNDYFNKIWSIHPFSSITLEDFDDDKFAITKIHKYNEKHIFVEGKIGRYKILKKFKIINFLLSQINVFIVVLNIFKNNEIKIIRSEDAWYCGLMAFIFSLLFRKTFLLVGIWGNPDTFRSINNKPMLSKFYKFIWIEKIFEKFVMKKADKVLVQNHDNFSFVKKNGITDEKISIFKLGNIIHPSHFIEPSLRKVFIDDSNILDKKNLQKTNLIICISRLEKMKLSDHFIFTCSILKQKKIPFIALFIGDGTLKKYLQKLTLEYDLKKEIIFCGNKNQEWISQIIPYSSVVISFITGRSLVEASLGAAPVVAYDIEWQKEIIINKSTGLLVNSFDYRDMASKIEFLLNNKTYAKKLGNKLRENTLINMDPKKIEKNQINFYNQLLLNYKN